MAVFNIDASAVMSNAWREVSAFYEKLLRDVYVKNLSTWDIMPMFYME